jgi:hypothetical protein
MEGRQGRKAAEELVGGTKLTDRRGQDHLGDEEVEEDEVGEAFPHAVGV